VGLVGADAGPRTGVWIAGWVSRTPPAVTPLSAPRCASQARRIPAFVAARISRLPRRPCRAALLRPLRSYPIDTLRSRRHRARCGWLMLADCELTSCQYESFATGLPLSATAFRVEWGRREVEFGAGPTAPVGALAAIRRGQPDPTARARRGFVKTSSSLGSSAGMSGLARNWVGSGADAAASALSRG
jgi:hypothetical protein